MKVLQIIDSLATGGAEKLLLDSIPLYREKGIHMDLIVLKDENYPFMQKLEALNCCKIYKLGGGSVYNPLLILKIAKILKDYPIAHVHLFPAQYWAVLAKIYSRVSTKFIFTEHSTSNKRMRNKLSKIAEKFIYEKYDVIVAITPAIRSILFSHVKSLNKNIKVIQNGILFENINKANPYYKKDLGFVDEDVLIIQVSSMQHPKDQKTLIRSMVHLSDEFKLVLVGDGILRKELENFVLSKNLRDRVKFLGKRNDVPQLLKTADIVVLSSKYEGLSLSSIEGMASGKPFIASDVPGLREIVEGAGLLFKQGDSQELASIISSLMEDEDLYNQTVIEGTKRAKDYDIENMVDKYIALYNKVLD